MSNDDAFAPTAVGSSDATAATESDTVGGGPRDSRVTLEIGKRLGDRYDIRGYLGEGGMGAVYRAFDVVLDEEVALKVVRGAFAGEAQLRDEVKIAQKVTHENVCRIYDLEDLAGYHVLKMEYVPGETLAARITEKGKLPVDEVVRIARAIAAGLQAAHARGIVHRDLKPGNIMLAGERVVLMDFGLARQITDEDVDLSGTPGYMSPEQLAGGRIDARSDLYALGCILYEMLAGERAFARGSMTEVASKQRAAPAPDVRIKRPDAPRWIVGVTRALMAIDPATREKGLARLVKKRLPRWVWLPVAALAMCAVCINAYVLMHEDDRLSARVIKPAWKPHFVKLAIDAPDSYKDRPSLSPKRDRLAFLHDVSYGGLLAEVVSVPFPDGGKPERIAALRSVIANPRYTRSEYMMVVIFDEQMQLKLVSDVVDPQLIAPGEDADDCGNQAIVAIVNPDTGRDRQAGLGDALKLYRNGKPEETVVKPIVRQGLDHPRCNADGTRVVIARSMHGISSFSLDDFKERVLTRESFDVTPTYTHEGTIVFARGGQLWEIADADNAKPTQLTTGAHNFVTPETSFRDPNALVVADHQTGGMIGVADATGELRIANLEARTDFVLASESVVAVNGTKIERIDFDGTVHVLADGTKPFLSLDGKRVFYAGTNPSELYVVPLAGGTPERVTTTLDDKPILDGADGPDGVHISFADLDLDVASYRVVSGKPIAENVSRLAIPAPAGNAVAILDGETVSTGDGFDIRCGKPVWHDAKRFTCAATDAPTLITHTLGRESNDLVKRDTEAKQLVMGRDGKHWLVVREGIKVDYYRITNFAARLR